MPEDDDEVCGAVKVFWQLHLAPLPLMSFYQNLFSLLGCSLKDARDINVYDIIIITKLLKVIVEWKLVLCHHLQESSVKNIQHLDFVVNY